MLSVAALSTGVSRVAAMLSPTKNPCRIRCMQTSAAAPAATWYRYDPYMSKVLPSPMKTLPSPKREEAPKHVNSLFAASATSVEAIRPRSFLAAVAAEPVKNAAKLAEKPKTHYAIVNFKHDSATFVAPFRVQVGDYVIVEGDRGEDLGCITEITTETPSYPVPLKVLRRAAPRDLERFEEKVAREQVTVFAVQKLAAQLCLPIDVVDTEFQFDNNKLTVYFNTGNGHTDFRKLQRSLFREHRCRIWLSNIAEVEYNATLQKTRRTR